MEIIKVPTAAAFRSCYRWWFSISKATKICDVAKATVYYIYKEYKKELVKSIKIRGQIAKCPKPNVTLRFQRLTLCDQSHMYPSVGAGMSSTWWTKDSLCLTVFENCITFFPLEYTANMEKTVIQIHILRLFLNTEFWL